MTLMTAACRSHTVSGYCYAPLTRGLWLALLVAQAVARRHAMLVARKGTREASEDDEAELEVS